jgi:hypothetical protein
LLSVRRCNSQGKNLIKNSNAVVERKPKMRSCPPCCSSANRDLVRP